MFQALWQTLEAKARFIQQVMNGETSVRTAEDITGGALTYAEIKAIASGNPAVMEKVKVDTEVRKLDSLRTSHAKRKFELRRKIGVTQTRIASNEEQLAMVGKDIATREANTGEQFAMTLAGRRYTGKEGREQAAKELNGVILTLSGDAEAKCRGQIAGFDMMTRATPDREVTAYLRGFAAYTFHHNLENPLGTMMSIERTLRGFEAIQARLKSDIVPLPTVVIQEPQHQRQELDRIEERETKAEPREISGLSHGDVASIYAAYDQLKARQGNLSAVSIGELAKESGVPVPRSSNFCFPKHVRIESICTLPAWFGTV